MKVLLFVTLVACVAYVYSQDDVRVNCPDLKVENPWLVSHPCNCSTYYVCMPPQPVPMPCPPGLQFHPSAQRCEWPWIAKCVPHTGCRGAFLDGDAAFEAQAYA